VGAGAPSPLLLLLAQLRVSGVPFVPKPRWPTVGSAACVLVLCWRYQTHFASPFLEWTLGLRALVIKAECLSSTSTWRAGLPVQTPLMGWDSPVEPQPSITEPGWLPQTH
jgi:hypothetical protein